MTGAPSPSAIEYASAGALREDKSYTNMSSFYGKNSGVEVLTCASIDEMAAVKIPAVASNWWCILVSSALMTDDRTVVVCVTIVIVFRRNSNAKR